MVSSTVEQIDETRIKLTVTVPAAHVDAALDAVYQRLGANMKVPGFRPGKVPKKILEKRVGTGVIQEEAARDSLPLWYQEAMGEHDHQPVGPPSFEIDTFEAGADAVFHATADIRPTFEVPEFAGMEISHPEWELTDEELDAQLDAMRDRFAEVETVERAAQVGDYVIVTITGKTADGEVVDDASAEDLLYQIPEEETDSELDKVLPGKEAGAILSFTDTLGDDYPEELAGAELEFTAILKEVKAKVLPELDDEFALTASEFDTIEEMKDDLREQMGAEKRNLARSNLRSKVVESVAELVDIPLPEVLVSEEQRFRLGRIAQQAEQTGLSFEQFLQLAGGGQADELLESVKAEAEQTVKAQLLVDAIGETAEISVEQSDLGEEVARQAMRLGRDPNEIAQLMLHPDRIGALYADAFRRKSIDHLIEQVTITNEPPPEPEPEDEPDLEDDDAARDEDVEETTAADEEE